MRSELDRRSLLEAALREQVTAGCPGPILAVDAPKLGPTFSGAAGLFVRGESRRLGPADPFRAASVTKAVTAAMAVILASLGRWELDDAITPLLPSGVVEKLRHLDGLPTVDALTVRRLLNHTSGLPDYFFDEKFQARVQADPDRIWRPEELVEAAAKVGCLAFPPGSDFSYGDTGYVLVGLAIERLLDRSLPDAYRSVIFGPLEMDSTYLEWHEAPPVPEISHHYDGDRDLRFSNTSFDWAGGGLVTTAGDLVRFLRGVFAGKLLDDRWRSELTRWREAVRWRRNSSARYLQYGLGMGVSRAYGEDLIGVTGVWGAFAYFWSSGDTAIAGTLNLVGADRLALLDAVIRALKQPV